MHAPKKLYNFGLRAVRAWKEGPRDEIEKVNLGKIFSMLVEMS
jgi:hypothetical protein